MSSGSFLTQKVLKVLSFQALKGHLAQGPLKHALIEDDRRAKPPANLRGVIASCVRPFSHFAPWMELLPSGGESYEIVP